MGRDVLSREGSYGVLQSEIGWRRFVDNEGALWRGFLDETETMRIEYDSARDLLYIWLAAAGEKAAKTVTVEPGMHADFDRQNRLIGIEVLDASEILRHRLQFEVVLSPSQTEAVADVPA